MHPCTQDIGVLRAIADRVRDSESIGNCPRHTFQVCPLESGIATVVTKLETGAPGPTMVVAPEEYTVGSMAEGFKSMMGIGEVVLSHPLQSPTTRYKPSLQDISESSRHQQHVAAEALLSAVADATVEKAQR